MIDSRTSLLSIFMKYFILTIIFIFVLKIYHEYYFFKKFNIEILNIINVKEIFQKERALSHLEQFGVVVFLPFIIVISFILHCYITDSLSTSWSKKIIFLYGILPFVFIFFEIKTLDISFLILVLSFSLSTSVAFWVMLFQVKQLQFFYLSVHLFLLYCFIVFIGTIARVNVEAKNYLRPSKIINAGNNLSPMLIGRRIILVGSTASFNFYYVPIEQRSIIIAKTE